jgi:hypothetical protein
MPLIGNGVLGIIGGITSAQDSNPVSTSIIAALQMKKKPPPVLTFRTEADG